MNQIFHWNITTNIRPRTQA